MYKKAFNILNKVFRSDQIFKYGFNFAPMYRRTVGRITHVSKDLLSIKVEIPLNYKNRNYTGSIFGGSLFSATDPIYMIQLIQILGDDYVVWDRAATINYRRPARSKVNATFQFTEAEITDIKQQVIDSKEVYVKKSLNLLSDTGLVFAELEKTMYVTTQEFYKIKMRDRAIKDQA